VTERVFRSRDARDIRRLERLVVAFVLVYLLVRWQAFRTVGAGRDSAAFQPVGVLWWMGSPMSRAVWAATMTVAAVAGTCALTRRLRRGALPVFTLAVLTMTTYRSSWGQLLWFENLLVVHLVVLAVAAAWGVGRVPTGPAPGWPIGLCAVATVLTYTLAGVAKLRAGGLDWFRGEVLANHVAYSAARLRMLGGVPSPLAGPLVQQTWLLTGCAAITVLAELLAPVALLGRRVAWAWTAVMWGFHAVIALTMFVVFPYPLMGVAFVPVLLVTGTARHHVVMAS
jgi:hypothetical protein